MFAQALLPKAKKRPPLESISMPDEVKRWSILLVDKEPVQRMLIGRMLTRAGYEVTTAEDGQQALKVIQDGNISLLITEWEMPNLDGIGLCRAVRSMQLPHYVYTIVVTKRDAVEYVVMGLQSGADDYLTKPVTEPELLARLNTGKRLIEMERALRVAAEENKRLAYSHPLTMVFNRRYLMEHLPVELQKAKQRGTPLSLVVCDIDYLKRINDTHGHAAGGCVLVAVAKFLEVQAQAVSGWLAHHGGDEFAMVLPNNTLSSAVGFAESVCKSLSRHVIRVNQLEIHITASFGVTGCQGVVPDDSKVEVLLQIADRCVYDSKSAGRNRLAVHELLGDGQVIDI